MSTSNASETVTPTSDLSSSSFPTVSTHNVPTLIPIKLHRDNYMLWKELFIPILQTYDMLSILDGSAPAPPRFLPLPNLSLSTTENPAFTLWTKKDRTCKIWLHASLSESILPYAVGCPTARDLWLTLEKRFANLTRSHVLQLKSRLQTLKKGSASMLDYLQSLKHIADSLAAAGAPLDTSDFLAHALSGLPSDYDAFATSIRVRSDPIQPDELHGLLLSEEIAVENRLTHIPPSDSHLHAFHTSQSSASSAPSPQALNTYSQSSRSVPRSHSSFSSSRPNNFTSRPTHYNSNFSRKPKCQICSKLGHSALTCRQRLNMAFQGPTPPSSLTQNTTPSILGSYNPSASFTSFTPPSASTTTWYADSGATNHITNNLANLSISSPYQGNESITVANGQHMPISHTGQQHGDNSLSRPY